MDRALLYDQTIDRTFDDAWILKDVLSALGYLANDVAGSTLTVLGGFAAGPTSPASLTINLAAGRILQNAPLDSSAFSVLPSDSTLVQQQGVAAAQSVTLSTAALASGQSQWALIQAQFSQADQVRTGDPTNGVLQYWNSNDPSQPYQGPGNDGLAGPTVRRGLVTLQVVLGTPATTGSEVPPNPSSGWVPLYLVDLAFGQTAITSGQILTAGPSVGTNVPNNYPNAPFLAGLLNSHHGGTAGQAPQIKLNELAPVSSANTGGGISTQYNYAGNPNGFVAGNAAVSGVSAADTCIDTADNILYFCSVTGNAASAVWNPTSGQGTVFAGGLTTGTANAQAISPVTPAGFALVAGYSVSFTPSITNAGATTLSVAGSAATACRKNSGGSLVAFTGGEFTAATPVTMQFNGTFWVPQAGIAPTGAAGGDLSSTYPNPTVAKLQGRAVSSTAPTNGQLMTWNSTSGAWVPANPASGSPSGAAAGDLGGTYPNPSVAALQGHPVSATAPTNQQVLTWSSGLGQWVPASSTGGPPSGSAGGDLFGNYPNPTVTQLQGRPVSSAAPSTNQVLAFNGSQWAPAAAGVGTITNVSPNNASLTGGGSSGAVVLAVNPASSAQVKAATDNVQAITSAALAGAMAASLIAGAGYQKLPNGLTVQWGTATVTNGSSASVNFATVFATAAPFIMIACPIWTGVSVCPTLSCSSGNTSGMTVNCLTPGNTSTFSVGFSYLVIGR